MGVGRLERPPVLHPAYHSIGKPLWPARSFSVETATFSITTLVSYCLDTELSNSIGIPILYPHHNFHQEGFHALPRQIIKTQVISEFPKRPKCSRTQHISHQELFITQPASANGLKVTPDHPTYCLRNVIPHIHTYRTLKKEVLTGSFSLQNKQQSTSSFLLLARLSLVNTLILERSQRKN